MKVPGSHYHYFTKSCGCDENMDAALRRCVLVKSYFRGNRDRPYFSYRCTTCGRALSDQVSHEQVGELEVFDIAGWMRGNLAPSVSEFCSAFQQLTGVLAPLVRQPPAFGEVNDRPERTSEMASATYFIDEAGDLTLFDRKGKLIVGSQGCSKYFILGLAIIEDVPAVEAEIESARERICNRAELAAVSSLAGTRRMFHACKDHEIVRDQLFSVIAGLPVKVCAIVRGKSLLAIDARKKFEEKRVRFKETSVYDKLVTTLVTDRLHQAEHSAFQIARRGKTERREHLEDAVRKAKLAYEKKWGVSITGRATVVTATPDKFIGLQIVDYLLWALQRVYERDDFTYFDQVRSKFSLIVDRDDKRKRPTGEYYTSANPLEPKIKKPFGG